MQTPEVTCTSLNKIWGSWEKKGCKLTVKEKMKKSLYCLQDYQHIATHLSSAGAVL